MTTEVTPRLMVVDDERSICATIRELFRFEGIPVVTASSGNECLARLREGFCGVILMDIMMPGMDGWDTIREIRNSGLHTGNIIVMLTALDAPDERMDGLQELVIDYITKPFSPDEIIANVKNYLRYLDDVQPAEA